ncbi:MAG: hypothetical protein VX684_10210, partial [Planctomycetota bacterium]|nr:hypothetical protein [Planctomycetota bacterium]
MAPTPTRLLGVSSSLVLATLLVASPSPTPQDDLLSTPLQLEAPPPAPAEAEGPPAWAALPDPAP